MHWLFALKALTNRYIGNNVNQFDVVVDFKALDEKGEFNVTVKGVPIETKKLGEVVVRLAERCLNLLKDVFGGVDSFPGGMNPHFLKFLQGEFRVDIDDSETATKDAMSFVYTVTGGSFVSSHDLEKLLLPYFLSLSPAEMVEKANAFYLALATLEAAISLVSILRSTEFAPIQLRDGAGGFKRTFRGFNSLRCPKDYSVSEGFMQRTCTKPSLATFLRCPSEGFMQRGCTKPSLKLIWRRVV
jgi:hypothetical protein